MLRTIFKISSNFSENAFVGLRKKKKKKKEKRKTYVFQDISTFSVFFFKSC